ncbi:ABC transporter permease [Corallococcus sp. H22C18031201]|uniref:ABC transporter ATP-binding protein n=1 Tax=Citreicoccus inhibens TaxID=2849499 RepID=UPI000E7269E5|nr:ABC transporter transmembrane domain-containing protein [Citreicoccus inhibens]MBU8899841.1 ATP-binding cassette domain-containing protein [Citreicoccus inhibens]RJS21823.1 ABC transporter permease [Corallococcus sp. H22C18031201]
MTASSRRPLSRVPFRRLVELARPEASSLALGTFFLVVGSFAGLLFPQALRHIVDASLLSGGPSSIDRIALGLVGIFLVQAVATSLRYVLYLTAGERIVNRLREQLYRSLLHQDIAFFDLHKTGELTSRLASDTALIQGVVTSNISVLLRNVIVLVGGVGFLVYTSPQLALAILLVVPAMAISAVAYGRAVRKLSREVQGLHGAAHHVASESLAAIRTVRTFAAEETEARRYAAALARAFAVTRQQLRASGIFSGGGIFGAYAAVALVFWYGGRLVGEGRLTVGALTSFLVYTLLVAMAMGALSDLWAELMKATGATERVFELIDRKPALATRGGLQPARLEGRVELEAVSFRYPARPESLVLRELSLTLNPGEAVAVVGPSGGGKSTLVALLTRLYDPEAGRILLDGKDLRELDPVWLRQRTGIVSQDPLLFSSSLADNIRYGRPEATDAEVEAAARAAHAHEFIQHFPEGYQTQVGERGMQLSGGQRQRVAIARAVLMDPRLLILDEATSALDAESEHLVKDALERLMKGRTTLVIAHRLSTVLGADRVVVIEAGRIVQTGNHAALMGVDGLYRRLVERQFVAA